jgi:hypothetical protein
MTARALFYGTSFHGNLENELPAAPKLKYEVVDRWNGTEWIQVRVEIKETK